MNWNSTEVALSNPGLFKTLGNFFGGTKKDLTKAVANTSKNNLLPRAKEIFSAQSNITMTAVGPSNPSNWFIAGKELLKTFGLQGEWLNNPVYHNPTLESKSTLNLLEATGELSPNGSTILVNVPNTNDTSKLGKTIFASGKNSIKSGILESSSQAPKNLGRSAKLLNRFLNRFSKDRNLLKLISSLLKLSKFIPKIISSIPGIGTAYNKALLTLASLAPVLSWVFPREWVEGLLNFLSVEGLGESATEFNIPQLIRKFGIYLSIPLITKFLLGIGLRGLIVSGLSALLASIGITVGPLLLGAIAALVIFSLVTFVLNGADEKFLATYSPHRQYLDEGASERQAKKLAEYEKKYKHEIEAMNPANNSEVAL